MTDSPDCKLKQHMWNILLILIAFQESEVSVCLKQISAGSCASDHLVALLTVTAVTERALGNVSYTFLPFSMCLLILSFICPSVFSLPVFLTIHGFTSTRYTLSLALEQSITGRFFTF